jgi:hypothetical protein
MILSTKRDSFAVLAADSLIGNAEGTVSSCSKLILHPSLPLAFAVGGWMWFPVDGAHASAMHHVTAFAARITSPDDLVVASLADQLRQLFQPGMDAMSNTIQVFIALVKDGKADVGLQQVSASTILGNPTQFRPGPFSFVIPRCLMDFFQAGPHLTAMHDPSVTDPLAVGGLARDAIQAGIDHERALNRGPNRVIGGPVDVVLVTAAGARLLP